MTRHDPQRGLSFDSEAHHYDRFRPRYPREVFDDIATLGAIDATSEILEVGCGPGVATEEMIARGWSVLAVDPGKQFAELARAKFLRGRFSFEVSTFDEWHPRGRRFDMLLAATAFHWVAPDLRWVKAAQILKDGALLALVTNEDVNEGSYHDFIEATRVIREDYGVEEEGDVRTLEEYRQWVTSARDDVGALWEAMSPHGSTTLARELFAPPKVRFYPWRMKYVTNEVRGLLGTYPRFLVLEREAREQLFTRLGEVIDNDFGGELTRHYVAVLATAQRYVVTERPSTP